MASDQRGMALVSVVLMLAAMLLLAMTLTEKVIQSSRTLGHERLRQVSYWGANSAIEWARAELTRHYLAEAGWDALLTAQADHPEQALWHQELNGVQVEIFLRDNLDGDDDPLTDNDLKVLVLARTGQGSPPEVLIECLCGFDSILTADSRQSVGGDLTRILDNPLATWSLNQ
ncbi:MAG: hypothetical protein C0614_07040 [Desulfuromonas sp.]|nr:MAG: hypothetical protein C0614_07040 [Desulfuromonas sp.]